MTDDKTMAYTRDLVFLDTETTSLRPDRRIWEVAMIRVPRPDSEGRTDGGQTRWQQMIHHQDLDLGNADPASLRIGGFYERHPSCGAACDMSWESAAMYVVEQWTRGATIVAAVPNFDTETLALRMRASGLAPAWHHRLVDVETMAAVALGEEPGYRSLGDSARALGLIVDPATRHTAMGDAELCCAIYFEVLRNQAIALASVR
jgi:DNA polymerase III epsilon subunit-like protein